MDNCTAYDERYSQAEWLLSEPTTETRVVLIQRDERGFGFVVAGDNPVFVQSVREGGAAERAGVLEGDVIVKVNGSSVRRANHADVVELIRAGGPCVGLTLVSPPPALLRWLQNSSLNHGMGPPTHVHPTMSPPPLHSTPSSRSLHHQPSMSFRSGGITGPQPADMDQQRVFDQQRRTTFKLMLEKEQQYMEEKRSELARGYNVRVADELAKVEKRVKDLQMKLTQLTSTNGAAHVHDTKFQAFHPRSPLPSRRSPTGHRQKPAYGHGHSEGGWDNWACDVPPPLPARNRSLVSQHSAPNFHASSSPPPPALPSSAPPTSASVAIPPPLPPRNPSLPHSSSCGPGLGSDAACRSGSPLTQSWDNLTPGSTASTNLPEGKSAGGSPLPSHHRTKSSPFPFVTPTNPDTRRFSSSDSISELDVNRIGRGESGHIVEEDLHVRPPPPGTPPGTPPPPYGFDYKRSATPTETDMRVTLSPPLFLSSPDQAHSPGVLVSPVLGDPHFHNHTFMGTPTHLVNPMLLGMGQEMQLNILSMEEDEFSDHDISSSDDHGPFNTLSKLWQHHAHLAVFLNFVVSNCDPAGLFFHLVTDLYKEGTTKEMKKWAYEIHSTFLVPNAPLKVTAVDEHILPEIDEVLLVDIDKEEILRRVFWKPRSRAKEELKKQLSEFQNKRVMGMGSIFGPVDSQLEEAMHEKAKEMKIIETCLLPILEKYSNAVENGSDRELAIASCLATVLGKVFGLKCPQAVSLIERCPSFVAKEKSLKSKFLSKSKKNHTVRGHHFVAHQYFSVTCCNSCGNVLWGIGPQGYQCTNCEMNIHKDCVRKTEENCIGALRRKDPSNNRISKIMEKIRPEREARRKPTLYSEKQRRSDEKDLMESSVVSAADIEVLGERPVSGSGLPAASPASSSNGNLRDSTGGRDRRSGTGSGSDSFRESDERHGYFSQDGTPPNEEETDSNAMPAARRKIVSRSESLRERAQRKHHREKRKHSDPNLPPSHCSDVDLEGRLSYNSGSSSNSSLSTRSLESPSPLDNVSSRVSGSGLSGLSDVSSAPSNSAATATTNTSSSGGCFQAWDSDIEADPDPPDWTKSLDKDLLEPMTPKEKQRQEVINELFHTERSHVRNLKVLERVFFRPLSDNGLMPSEIFALLFAHLPDVLEIHAHFNALMKARKREQPVVQQVGDILLAMFDGPAGESFQRAASQFCQNQSIALEALKERRKKDSKLQAFLSEAEGNPVCRRLQLKDMIPSVMQRLTKYPLLLESLAKYTPPRSEELSAVRKALERSKEILNKVNQAVKEAENYSRLTEIQRRLDRSSFDKMEGNTEHRNFELTKQRLLYEGALVWRNRGQKNLDIHMVLLEEYIVLLQKQDDKYILKPHSITCSMGKEESKQTYSPILKIQNVLVRQVATDKLAFFLVNTSNAGAQMMELVASSMADKKGWFRHIIDAGEAHGARTKRGEQLAPPTHPSIPSEPEKKDDELLDVQDNVSSDSGLGLTPGTEVPAPPSVEAPPVASSVVESASSASQEQQVQAQTEAAKKAASQPPSPSQSSSPAPQRRFQRVEILKIAEGTPLIEPSEVVVSQGAVLTAEPVLTPLEKLRRKDQLIRTALSDKQRLVADILHVPQHEFEAIAEMAGEAEGDKEARELVLAAILQASRLSSVLNESLRLTEEEAIAAMSEPSPIPSSTSPRLSRKISRLPGVPAHKLVNISASINKHLTQLLGIITQRDEEREHLRRELQRYRDLVPSPQTVVPVSLSSASSQTQSRPHSFISSLSAEEDTPMPSAVTVDRLVEHQVNGEVSLATEEGPEGLTQTLEPQALAESVNTEVITVVDAPIEALLEMENTIVIPEQADVAKSGASVESQTSEA